MNIMIAKSFVYSYICIMMSRFVMFLCIVVSIFSILSCEPDRIKEDAPNILLITVDTLRMDHLSIYGYPRQTSPNIDALGSDGAVFTESRAQATSTMPSHQSIFTSTYPIDTGVVANEIPMDVKRVTLAEILKNHGYRTGAIVSNFTLRKEMLLDKGFDDYDDYFPSRERNREHYEKPPKIATLAAISWFNKIQSQRFFLWVHYQGPHGPYTPTPPFDKKFSKNDYSTSKRIKKGDENFIKGTIAPYQILDDHDEYDYYVDQYDGEISETDHWIGILFNHMKEKGLLDNTLIIFTSDHGESLGEHDRFFEHSTEPYEELTLVPLIIYYPRIISEHRLIHTPVQGVDIMPTILDICGIKGKSLRGISLVPMLQGQAVQSRKDPILSQSNNAWSFAIYQDEWKFMATVDNPHREELYNLKDDPKESKNLISQGKKMAEPLRRILHEYLRTSPKPGKIISRDSDEKENLRSLGYIN